ncbi:MAG: type II toxin-antitoxin system VapC family toxin [Deltaproteobacteria bacterium]|nr:type II toxin-antitoxin system VapC family toxin [Deltaproteobacteria bacterium]
MIVTDTNIIVYLFLTGDRSKQAEKAFLKDPSWAAPILWRSEFLNVLTLYIRKEILILEEAQEIMEEAMELMRGREYEVAPQQVLKLAVNSTCSAYDCEFIALANDLASSLVTVDKQILHQFPDIAVSLDQFAAD